MPRGAASAAHGSCGHSSWPSQKLLGAIPKRANIQLQCAASWSHFHFSQSKKRSEAPLHWRQHKTHNRNKYRESATMRTEISGRRTIQYAFAILPIRPRAQRRRTVCLYKYGCRWFAAPAVCCVWRGRVRCATRRSAPIRDADLEFDRHPDLIRDHGSRPILPSQFSHSDTLDASLDVL